LSELAGVADGRLRVRLKAPAHEGKANAELIRFVAEVLGVLRADVRLVNGAGGRRKTVRVYGVNAEAAGRCLGLSHSED
jgi:uncharacterized protein